MTLQPADMKIKLIKTSEDHKAALEEIDRLFDAEPDTPECDRLEVLAILVEAYEKEHYPISPPSPDAIIEHYLESRGLDPTLMPVFQDFFPLIRYLISENWQKEGVNEEIAAG